jgi:hypothetical protein
MRQLLGVHLVFATSATVAFWIAALTTKGGPTHRVAGLWSTWLLYSAGATGAVLAIVGLLSPQPLESAAAVSRLRHLMWLVLYLLVVIVAPAQHGLAVVTAGPSPSRVRSPLHLALSVLALVASVALLPAAVIWQELRFFLVMPAGFLIGLRNMTYAARRSATPVEWEVEHLTSMLTAGIAFHTLVLVLTWHRGPSLFGPGLGSLVPWVTPAVVGLPIIAQLRRTRSR